MKSKGFRSATIVLVSDGESTCGGDPCKVAEQIKAEGFNLTVRGVGFELSGKGREEIECIAETTNGRYYSVANGQELIDTLSTIAKHDLQLTVQAPKKVIGGGVANIEVVVRNASLTESVRDVRISLAFTHSGQMFPKIAPPVLRMGNLPPGGSTKYTWHLPVATVEIPGPAQYRIVAASTSGANGRATGEVTVVKSDAFKDVVAGQLGSIRNDNGNVGVFGDSYAAGEGSGDYLPGTDSIHPRCHRSEFTHVAQLFGAERTRNFACSAAVQHHLFAPFPGRMETTSQVEEMSRTDVALDAAFLSIGDNDMGFGDIVTRCLLPNRIPEPSLLSMVVRAPVWKIVDNECGHEDADARGEPIGEDLADRAITERLSVIRGQLPGTYISLYDAVNVGRYVSERGHEAPLFVLAYPKVFPEVVGIGCGEFAPREVTFANKVVAALNKTLSDSVEAATEIGDRKIYFVDAVEQSMQPSNTLCDAQRSGIVGVLLAEGASKKFFADELAQELVHPNKHGYARIAGAIASWSSGPTAPVAASGKNARQSPNVAGAQSCEPVFLPTDQNVRTDADACLIAQVDVSEPSTYRAEMHSVPVALGGGVLDAGTQQIRVDLPTSLRAGRHTLQVAMVSEAGVITHYAVQLSVAEPLPWWWWLIAAGSAALLVAALGLAMRAVLLARRDRRSRAIDEKS